MRSIQIDPAETDNGWVIRADALSDAVLARAVGHWLEERFDASFSFGQDGLTINVPRREPTAGAIEWIVAELARGRTGFEALGFASTHLAADEVRNGLEVLTALSGEPGPPIEGATAGTVSSPATAPHRRLETIGDSTTPTEQAHKSAQVAGSERVPRIGLETIGRGSSLPSEPPCPLPGPNEPGRYELTLVEAGPDPHRTAALLSAALGLEREEANALTARTPVVVAPRASARVVRQVDSIVRAAGRATFKVVPLAESQG